MLETRRARVVTVVGLSAVLALLLAVGGYVYRQAPVDRSPGTVIKETGDDFAEPGSVPIGGDFELVDEQGETVTPAAYDDAYKLVFFGFTHCPDICPTTLGDISRR